MKRLLSCIVALSLITLPIFAQSGPKQDKYMIFLTGASFAAPQNGWFELGCEAIGATPVNKAVNGQAIADPANWMSGDSLYSRTELEEMDAFVIMQVHDRDVFNPIQLKEELSDYQLPFDRNNYAAAYDYVIKKYLTDCYNLQFDRESAYFGKQGGKPAVIILCTHWNDARPTYNSSIRKLSEKWGLPLVEFDKLIGFSKNQPHPVTKEPISKLFGEDLQTMNYTVHGFHPLTGKDQYIQQRMAAIFADVLRKIFL